MISCNNLKAAIDYANRGWYVFPVTPNEKTPAAGLAPRGYHDATLDHDQIKSWWMSKPNANIGLNLEASGMVCVDVDSYKEDCAFEQFMHNKTLPPTLTQRSASGGTHYLFIADTDTKYPGKLCAGVDIKHRGYVLLWPSRYGGKSYEWANRLPLVKAPSWVAKPVTVEPALLTPSLVLPRLKHEDLLKTIDAEGWHNTVLRLVGSLVAKGKSDDDIHDITNLLTQDGYLLHETQAEVQKMIDGARAKGFEVTEPSNPINLKRHDNRPSYANYHTVHETLLEASPWAEVFALNELTGLKMVVSKPPGERGNPSFFKPRQLKESDYTKVIMWLNCNGFPSVNKQVVIDCVRELCEQNTISPVKHYLEELSFDPEQDASQLSSWMQTYLGVEPSSDEELQYIRAVSRLSLIQAVARAMDPGCKADSVPILEGGQGIGKSSAIRVLHGADWFGDALPPMSHKDASDYVRGKWGIELAELAFQQKAEIEAQKAFISRREERFRPAYGREEVCYPRRCVFWGTTNRTDYVKDDTGNRRFLPVKTTKVDLEGLQANRDKLWAEALYYYQKGEQYWLTGDIAEYADRTASERIEDDAWVELVQEHLRGETELSLKEACTSCFPALDDSQMDQRMTRRMSLCLQQAGWRKDGRFTKGAKRNQARFVREAEDANEDDLVVSQYDF